MNELREFFSIVSGPVITFTFASYAHAADTLPAVSPPTDWTGVAIVAAVAVLAVAIAAYIVHIKRTPGLQLGEEQLERLAEMIHKRQEITINVPPAKLVYDGLTFADQSKLDEYKAAKATIESFKTGAAP